MSKAESANTESSNTESLRNDEGHSPSDRAPSRRVALARALRLCLADLAEAADRLAARLGVDPARWTLADLRDVLAQLDERFAAGRRELPPTPLHLGRNGTATTVELAGLAPGNAALVAASDAALAHSRAVLTSLQLPWESCRSLTIHQLLAGLDATLGAPPTNEPAPADSAVQHERAPRSPRRLWTVPYQRAALDQLPADLADAVGFVVAVEQPIHRERVVWLLQGAGRREADTAEEAVIEAAIDRLAACDLVLDGAGFLQQRDQPTAGWVRVPTEDPATRRPWAHISLAELGRAAHGLASTVAPLRAELADGVAAVFGLPEPLGRDRVRIDRVVEFLLAQGVLAEHGDSIATGRAGAAEPASEAPAEGGAV